MIAQLGLGAVSGISSLAGILGDQAAKRRAEAARQAAINDMSGQLDTDYQNMMQRNQTSLSAAAGQGGDAVASMGRRLGASLAGAGVYNSSATAGALVQAQGQQDANLSNMAQSNFYNENSLLNHNRQYITGMRANLAQNQYDQANSDLSASRGGLSQFLGTLGQYNLGQSGATNLQKSIPAAYGGYGNQGMATALTPETNYATLFGAGIPMSPGTSMSSQDNFNAFPFGSPSNPYKNLNGYRAAGSLY